MSDDRHECDELKAEDMFIEFDGCDWDLFEFYTEHVEMLIVDIKYCPYCGFKLQKIVKDEGEKK